MGPEAEASGGAIIHDGAAGEIVKGKNARVRVRVGARVRAREVNVGVVVNVRDRP